MKTNLLQFLSRAASILESISVFFGKLSSISIYLLLFFMLLHVTLRYVFRLNLIQLEEVHWHLYATTFLLGYGYTYLADGHVRVDLFYDTMSARRKAWINLLGTLILLLPFCFIIEYFAIRYFWASWLIGESSDQPGALPARYVLKFVLVLGLAVLSGQALAVLFRSILVLAGGKPDKVAS